MGKRKRAGDEAEGGRAGGAGQKKRRNGVTGNKTKKGKKEKTGIKPYACNKCTYSLRANCAFAPVACGLTFFF